MLTEKPQDGHLHVNFKLGKIDSAYGDALRCIILFLDEDLKLKDAHLDWDPEGILYISPFKHGPWPRSDNIEIEFYHPGECGSVDWEVNIFDRQGREHSCHMLSNPNFFEDFGKSLKEVLDVD